MDNVYLSLQDLVGATPYSGSKIQIRTDRSLPTGIWAYSGNPIRINQLHMGQFIEQINNDGNWGFGVLHELGHDFDSGKNWNFDAEFFANFKAAYAIMQRGAKVYVGNSYYTGSQIMNYYYNGASSCYLTSYNVGSYHHDFLTYIFLRIIQNNFGGDWTAIKKTFRYFSLNPSYVPSGNKDRLDLFFTKIRDYSGVDVLSLLNSQEKAIIQNHFGGTLKYSTFSITNRVPIDVSLTAGESIVFEFKPASTGTWDIYTEVYASQYPGTSCDTYLEIFSNPSLTQRLAYNDDFNSIRFSHIEIQLTANVTYYIKLRPYSQSIPLSTRIFARGEPSKPILPTHLMNAWKQLEWSGETQWQSEFNSAVGTWNAYKPSLIKHASASGASIIEVLDYHYDDGNAGSFNLISGILLLSALVMPTYSSG
jgi:hypothetical protein